MSTTKTSTDTCLRTVTLNCWGLKYVSKQRTLRMKAIAEELATKYTEYDVIALQEIWVYDDFLNTKKVLSFLPYSKFFHSAVLGGGLAIFSRYEIIETSFKPYSLNNSPLHILEGDWIVGKGAASVVFRHPIAGDVEVFNTHFCAGFGEGPEWTQTHRIAQAWEISRLIKISIERGRQVIAMGDFNSISSSCSMSILYNYAYMRDSWSELHGNTLPLEKVENDQIAIKNVGVTCNSPLNTWSAGKRFDDKSTRWRGKRLDYILYREGKDTTHPLSCIHSEVVFVDLIPDQSVSFSDHYGVAATFEINPVITKKVVPLTVPPGFFKEISSHLRTYQEAARAVARGQLIRFGLCMFLTLGLIISSAFQPKKFLNWIFPLCVTPTVWYGATMLYSGFLYGRWEQSALDHIAEEMELAAQLEGEQEDDDLSLLAGGDPQSGTRRRKNRGEYTTRESKAPPLCLVQ